MPPAEAARLDDPIGHTNAMAGLLAGAIAGVVIAGAIVAIVGTGGVAAVAIGAGIAASGASGALGGAYIGELIPTAPTGLIATGSSTVKIGYKSAARAALDTVPCSGVITSHATPPVAEGADSVFIDGMPAARRGDKIACGASIAQGCATVIIGGGTRRLLEVDSEVPEWLSTTLWVVMIAGTIIATGGAAAVFGWGPALGGLGGSLIGSYTVGRVGERVGWLVGGELGARIGQVGGGFLGAFGGGWAGARLGRGMGGFPDPTPASDNAAGTISEAMDAVGIGRTRGRAITALSHEDGSISYGVSGNPESVQATYDRMGSRLPGEYTSGDPNAAPSLQPAFRDGEIFPGGRSCSEARAWEAARTNPSPVEGQTTIWRGNRANPYPSPRGGSDMLPCPSCSTNSNAIMGTPSTLPTYPVLPPTEGSE